MKDQVRETTASQAGSARAKNRAGALLRGNWGWIALAALIIVPIVVDHPYYREILALIFLWSAMAGAWNIVGGYAGKFSLGHAAFFGVGAYTSGLLYVRLGVTPWLGMIAGMALAVLLALFIGIVTLRLKGKFFALCTIAFGQLIEIMAIYLRSTTGGSEGLLIPFKPGFWTLTFSSKLVWVYIFCALMLLVYFISRWLERSALGYQLSALREDEDAAEALGVNTLRAKLVSISLSAALTAMGGSLFGQYFLWLEPGFVTSLDLSTQFALFAIIGGMGTAIGPILGATLITPLQIFLRAALGTAASGISMLVYGVLLVVVVLFMPKGISVEVGGWIRKLSSRSNSASVAREGSHVA
ncbi:MAG: branched-chain amino acid ABC transporter permease [Syntrophobacter sp.]